MDYFYDLNLGIQKINGKFPTLFDLINGVPVIAQIFIRRIALSKVPINDEHLCSEFLHNLYKEKVNSVIFVENSLKKLKRNDIIQDKYLLRNLSVPSGHHQANK